jgi:hypothetical protein
VNGTIAHDAGGFNQGPMLKAQCPMAMHHDKRP